MMAMTQEQAIRDVALFLYKLLVHSDVRLPLSMAYQFAKAVDACEAMGWFSDKFLFPPKEAAK